MNISVITLLFGMVAALAAFFGLLFDNGIINKIVVNYKVYIENRDNFIDEGSVGRAKEAKTKAVINVVFLALVIIALGVCTKVILSYREHQGELSVSIPNNDVNTEDHNGTNASNESVNQTDNEPGLSEPSNAFDKKTVPMANGTYYGQVDAQDRPNGQGEMTFDSGNKYEGEWFAGEISGYGTMWYSNGDIYTGPWKGNKKHGQNGKYTWFDGKQYIGDYYNDKRHGQGTFSGWSGNIYADETWEGTYVGHHENDVFQGSGEFTMSNGDTFIGEFDKGQVWSGTYTENNGNSHKIENGRQVS